MELSSSNISSRSRLIQEGKPLPFLGHLHIAQIFLVLEIGRLCLQGDCNMLLLSDSALKTSYIYLWYSCNNYISDEFTHIQVKAMEKSSWFSRGHLYSPCKSLLKETSDVPLGIEPIVAMEV